MRRRRRCHRMARWGCARRADSRPGDGRAARATRRHRPTARPRHAGRCSRSRFRRPSVARRGPGWPPRQRRTAARRWGGPEPRDNRRRTPLDLCRKSLAEHEGVDGYREVEATSSRSPIPSSAVGPRGVAPGANRPQGARDSRSSRALGSRRHGWGLAGCPLGTPAARAPAPRRRRTGSAPRGPLRRYPRPCSSGSTSWGRPTSRSR